MLFDINLSGVSSISPNNRDSARPLLDQIKITESYEYMLSEFTLFWL